MSNRLTAGCHKRFVDSPSIFNRALAQDLQHLDITSTLIPSADDLLLCSKTKEQCEKDSVALLTTLAQGGHKVSKDKLQFCQQQDEYLGRQLYGGERHNAPSQVEAITNAPRSQTVGQMLSFLGMMGYSCPWICEYALKTTPLRALIKVVGQANNAPQLQWTDEAEAAFQALKGDLCTAPALGNPDYSKPSHLCMTEKSGYATAEWMQDTPSGKQPLAYYNTEVDSIEAGLPPCY